tara:strand:+ start:159 stop:698 length:540 start_codon:yes stop_codon:yes gene_type:complete
MSDATTTSEARQASVSTPCSAGLLFSMDGIEHLPQGNQALSPTVNNGCISEILFAAEAMERGFVVFSPLHHATKADCVIWAQPSPPLTIQIKRGKATDSGWRILLSSATGNRLNARKTYKRGDFDYLCAHIPETGDFAFYCIDDVIGRHSMTWRPDRGPHNNWSIIEQDAESSHARDER